MIATNRLLNSPFRPAAQTMTDILLIEDDPFATSVARQVITSQGYGFTTATTGREGIESIRAHAPDVILLDLGLPDMDGILLMSQLRALTPCPIVVVSTRSDTQSKVTALDLGADDFITKPFVGEELMARIRSVLRRAMPSPELNRVAITETLEFDPQLRILARPDGQQSHLTTIESMLLGLLLAAQPRPISRQTMHPVLFNREWTRGDRTLDVHVHNLRQKLLTISSGEVSIASIRGIGYVLQLPSMMA